MSDEQELRRLEQLLLEPDVRASTARVAEFLADEFVEFGSSGTVYSKESILETLVGEEPAERTLSDFLAHELSPGVVLVTYRSERRKPSGDVSAFVRSSVWKRINGRWLMVFHQGTPTAS